MENLAEFASDENTSSSRFLVRRSARSVSHSAQSDRSLTPPTAKQQHLLLHPAQQQHHHAKILPPVIKFKHSLDTVDSSNPEPSSRHHHHHSKPFLQSAASILHPKSKKDLLQRRALISLPPIKPFELSQLAVESPLKGTHNNTSLFNGSNLPKNNSNN